MTATLVRGLKLGMGVVKYKATKLVHRCPTCRCDWGYVDEDDNILCGQCGRIQS